MPSRLLTLTALNATAVLLAAPAAHAAEPVTAILETPPLSTNQTATIMTS